jgi:hypothetical protein
MLRITAERLRRSERLAKREMLPYGRGMEGRCLVFHKRSELAKMAKLFLDDP